MNSIYGFFEGILNAVRDPQVRGLLALTATLVFGASVFYHYVEGWKPLDCLYFSVMTLATVGYGDYAPKTDLGKLFTIFYVIIGLGIFVSAATALGHSIIAERNNHRAKRSKTTHKK